MDSPPKPAPTERKNGAAMFASNDAHDSEDQSHTCQPHRADNDNRG